MYKHGSHGWALKMGNITYETVLRPCTVKINILTNKQFLLLVQLSTCRITYFYSTVVPDSNIGIAIIKLLTMSIAHTWSVTDMQPVMFTASLCFTLHNTIERAIYGTTDAFINMLGRVVLSHSCHTFFVLPIPECLSWLVSSVAVLFTTARPPWWL